MNALCNTCGAVRTLRTTRRSTYRPPGMDYDTGTCDLKCSNCQQITRHALVLSDADRAEWERQLARSRPDVKVCRSAELEQDALWIASHRILLVHSSVTAEDVADLLRRVADR